MTSIRGFYGNLYASSCGRKEILPNVQIRVYKAPEGEEAQEAVQAAIASPPKETFKFLDEKEVDSKKNRLLAEIMTDDNGFYETEVDNKQKDYLNGPVEFDIRFNSIPDIGQGNTEKSDDFEPFQVHYTTVKPKLKDQYEENTEYPYSFQYNIGISQVNFGRILDRLDIWMICGRVYICPEEHVDTERKPAPGIEVIAMDNDWIHDDQIGSAQTDAQGYFCIFYRSADFKKTFLSPVVNVETPFSSDFGPDVYFHFAHDGNVFHKESPSKGKESERENIGNIYCVTLCVPEIPVPDEPPNKVAGFFSIGLNRRYDILSNISTSTGRTKGKPHGHWNGNAFFGTLALIGTLTKKLNGNDLEYKFQYREYDAPGGTALSGWEDVLPGQIANTVIGYTQKLTGNPANPVETTYYAIHPHSGEQNVPFNGNWISVPQLSNLFLNSNGLVLNLRSHEIASGSVNMSGLTPGNSTTGVASLQKNRYFKIRMLKREKGSSTEVVAGTSHPLALFNTVYQNVPQGGSWISGTSNMDGVASMDIQELGSSGCDSISDALHVEYTAANPNLGNVSVNMNGPGGPHSFPSISHNTPGEEAYGTVAYSGTVSALQNCAYTVNLRVSLKMTNGETNHHGLWDEVAFCKR